MTWKNLWPYQDSNSDPSVVQPTASHYIDCAILAPEALQCTCKLKVLHCDQISYLPHPYCICYQRTFITCPSNSRRYFRSLSSSNELPNLETNAEEGLSDPINKEPKLEFSYGFVCNRATCLVLLNVNKAIVNYSYIINLWPDTNQWMKPKLLGHLKRKHTDLKNKPRGSVKWRYSEYANGVKLEYVCNNVSRDSIVSIETCYGLDDRGVGVRVPVKENTQEIHEIRHGHVACNRKTHSFQLGTIV
jgi:hypothetical protein